MNTYINEIEQTLNKDIYTKADITYIMSQFRLILEDDNLKEKYKYLNLYCNWTLHTQISGSKTAYRIMELLTDALIDHNAKPESMWLNDSIIVGLSLHKLLIDIISIGEEYNISSAGKFQNLESWKPFAKTLINVLAQRPLKFPNPITISAKPIYDSIIAKSDASQDKDTNAVVGVKFICEDNIQHWNIDTIHSLKEQKKIIGPMAFITQDMVDKYVPPPSS